MPQTPLESLLLNRPQTDSTQQLPATGTETWLDALMHKAGVATGVSEQRPGDLGDAAAAVATMFPLGRILRAAKGANAVSEMEKAAQAGKEAKGVFATPAMAAEFGAVDAGARPALPPEEAQKAAELTKQPSSALAAAIAKIRALQAGDKPGYRQVPFSVADINHPDLAADYNKPRLVDVDIDKLIATQPTVTEDVVERYLNMARERANQLPAGVYGAPRVTNLPVVVRGPDDKIYIGDGTHRIVADWAKGSPTVQAIEYPSKNIK